MKIKLWSKIIILSGCVFNLSAVEAATHYPSDLQKQGMTNDQTFASPLMFQKEGYSIKIFDPNNTSKQLTLTPQQIDLLRQINVKIGDNIANNDVSSHTIESLFRACLLSDVMGTMKQTFNQVKAPLFESPFVKEVKILNKPTVSLFKSDEGQKLWHDVQQYLNFCELAYFDKNDFANINPNMRTKEKQELDRIKDDIVVIEEKLNTIKKWFEIFNTANFHTADVAVEGTKNQTQTFARRATMTPSMTAKYDLRQKFGKRLDELAIKDLKPDDFFNINDPEFVKRASHDLMESAFYRIKEFINAQKILKRVESELWTELIKLQEQRAIQEDPGMAYYAHRQNSLTQTGLFKENQYRVIGVMYRNQNGFSLGGALKEHIPDDALDSRKSNEQKITQSTKGELSAAILKRVEGNDVEIVIAFSGSKSENDWHANLSVDSKAFNLFKTDRGSSAGQQGTYGIKGHKGIFALFGESLHQSKELLKSLFNVEIGQGKKIRITVTGHSLGGALSILMAAFLKDKIMRELPKVEQNLIEVKCFSYAAPPIVNQWSAWQILKNLGEGNIYRVWVPGDPVANISILQDDRSLTGRSLLQRWLGWYHLGQSICLYHIFQISDVDGIFDFKNKWKNHLIESYHNSMAEVDKILQGMPKKHDLQYSADESIKTSQHLDEYEKIKLFLELLSEKLGKQQQGAFYPEITENQTKEIRYLSFDDLKKINEKYAEYKKRSEILQKKSKEGSLTIKDWKEITQGDPYFSADDIELLDKFIIPETKKKNFIDKILIPGGNGAPIVFTSSTSSDPSKGALGKSFPPDYFKEQTKLKAKKYFENCLIKHAILNQRTLAIKFGVDKNTLGNISTYCWKKYQKAVCKTSKKSSSTELKDIRSDVCQSTYRNQDVFDFAGDVFGQTNKIIIENNVENAHPQEKLQWRWDNLNIKYNPKPIK